MVEEYELVANMFEIASEKFNVIIKEKLDKVIQIIDFFSE
jgi:hypothetical protein